MNGAQTLFVSGKYPPLLCVLKLFCIRTTLMVMLFLLGKTLDLCRQLTQYAIKCIHPCKKYVLIKPLANNVLYTTLLTKPSVTFLTLSAHSLSKNKSEELISSNQSPSNVVRRETGWPFGAAACYWAVSYTTDGRHMKGPASLSGMNPTSLLLFRSTLF